MDNENVVIPHEELPVVNLEEDVKPLSVVKPAKAKVDPDVTIKFVLSDKGQIIAKLVGGEKEFRIVPNAVKLSLVYPIKIKSSLWNSLPIWSKK